MNGDPHQIIVEAGDALPHACSAVLVHHRDFPEIHAEGLSALEAAGHLLRRLGIALDGTPNHWHRDDLRRAIADLQDFLDRGGQPGSYRCSSAPGGEGTSKPSEPSLGRPDMTTEIRRPASADG